MNGTACLNSAHWSAVRLWLMISVLPFLNGCGDPVPNRKNSDTSKESVQVTVIDLDGKSVNPFQVTTNAKLTAFFFLSTDCPISNRYAPEIQRLAREFNINGVSFRLVYPDPDTTVEAIRKHTNEYRHSIPVLRDPQHALVKTARVAVTPEVAVFLPEGKLVYSGRIDNRYLDFGKERPTPSKRDLQEVLRALLRGDPILFHRQPAVGCSISSP